jgi:hypothetical protein
MGIAFYHGEGYSAIGIYWMLNYVIDTDGDGAGTFK